MKKRATIAATVMLAASIGSACLLSGCSETAKIFGEFGYNGKYLYSFATEEIQASRAKNIVETNVKNLTGTAATSVSTFSLTTEIDFRPDTDTVSSIMNNYSACVITTKYYVEGKNDPQTKVDDIRGTDFRNLLEENQFTPFTQLVAKHIISFPALIDKMEQANTEFKATEESLIAPFKNIFTYYTNSAGQLVVHTSDFAEIASSVGGGIGSSYRQDTEILYDSENKMQKWQTSLGLYSASPEGTMKQGYILEMEFEWIPKT